MVLLLLLGLALPPTAYSAAIDDANAALGRGINLGNALEAPTEGDWGLVLQAGYFDIIADAGFDSIRVPIRWSAHADASAPFTIDGSFFERIDWVLNQAERVGLVVVINMHHYNELMENPAAHRARFLNMWQQISTRYANRPDSVFFELLNEPTGAFNNNPNLWNQYAADALAIVRDSNPSRPVIIGPVGWNSIDRLAELSLPLDQNIITTVHFYDPFEFTHQGANWVNPIPPLGTSWQASTQDIAPGFENWSWDTTLTPWPGRLRVQFASQYAGLSLRTSNPMTPTSLTIPLQGQVQLDIGCSSNGGEFNMVGSISNSGSAWRTVTVNLRACGSNIDRIVLQNTDSGPATLTVRNGRICTTSGCRKLFRSYRQSLRDQLALARQWGADNTTPVYVGEFGAYGSGDLLSRALWTREVQSAVQSYGMSSAYWEFAAGFGAYNRYRSEWVPVLLRELMR